MRLGSPSWPPGPPPPPRHLFQTVPRRLDLGGTRARVGTPKDRPSDPGGHRVTPRRWAIPVLIAVVVVAWISPPAKAQGSATMYFRSPVAAVVDGQIPPGEYSGSFLDPTTGIELFLVHDGRNMTVGLVSPGTGWGACGLRPPRGPVGGGEHP